MTDEYATSDARRLGNLEAERAAMARMLEMSEGVFSLSIAICNSPAQRDRIVQDVRADRPTIALVSAPYDGDDLLESVRRKLDRQNPSGLFVVGIETILPSDPTNARALRSLNASRESWKKAFACPVVFWVPEYVARLLCIHAQDFWSWISHQFDFSPERALEPAGAVSVDAPLPVQNLTRKEKQLRIRELKERIANVPDTASPQLKRHMSRWLMELGTLYYLQGDYDEAMSCYEQSLKTNEASGNRAGVSASLHQIGMVHQDHGDYDKALHYYEKSLQTKEELGDRAGVSASLHQIGNVHYLRGDYDKALHYYEKSLKTKEELGDRAGISASLHQIGMVHQDRGDYDKALHYYEKSLKTSEELGDRAGVSTSLHQIGMVHQDRGDYDKALHYYEKSLKTTEELGDRAGISKSLHQIGMVHQDRGDYDKALHYYEKSLKTHEELGDRLGLGQSHGQMGQLCAETGRPAKAFDHFLLAFSIFAEIGSPDRFKAVNELRALRTSWGAESFDKAWREKTGEDVPEGLKQV